MVSTVKPPPNFEAAIGSDGMAMGKDLTRRIGPYVDDFAQVAARNTGMNPNVPGPDDLLDQHAKKKGKKSAKDAAERTARQAEGAVVSDGPDTMDKVLGGTEQVLGMSALAVPLGAGALNLVGDGVKKVGGMTNFVGAGDRVGGALKKPSEFINTKTLSDLGKGGLGGPVNRVAQALSNGTAFVVDPIMRIGGLNKRISRSHELKAGKHFGLAGGFAGKIDHALIPAEVQEHMAEVTKAIKSGKIEHLAAPKAAEALQTMETILEKDAKLGAKLGEAGNGLIKTAGDALHHHTHAAGWKDVGGSIRNAPKAMSKASVSSALMNGSFIAMSGISMVNDGRSFSKNLANLKQMYADITDTDVKNVSTVKVLLGSVPAPVAEARSHILKNTLIKGSADAVNVGVNLKQAIDHKFVGTKAIAAFLLPGLVSAGADAVMGQSVLPMYKALSDAHKSGREIPPEVYAEFLGAASKDLKARGGASSPFTQELAKQYAAEKAAPKDIMKEIASGKLLERVKGITAAVEAKAAQEAAQNNGNDHASMVDTVKGKKHRPVIGEHTGKVAGDGSITSTIQRFI